MNDPFESMSDDNPLLTTPPPKREQAEAVEVLQMAASIALKNAASQLDDIAQTMREHEQHFNEDDFDELGRLASLVYEIAERAKP